MAGKEVAVEGMAFEFSPATVTGTVQIITPPSPKLKITGKGVYAGPVDILITNIKDADKGTAVPGLFSGTFQPTAGKLTSDGQAVLRVGDEIPSASDNGMAQKPGPNGAPVPSPISFGIKIKDPGQSKVTSG